MSLKTRVIDVSVVDLEHKEVETGLHAHFKFGEHRQIRLKTRLHKIANYFCAMSYEHCTTYNRIQYGEKLHLTNSDKSGKNLITQDCKLFL